MPHITDEHIDQLVSTIEAARQTPEFAYVNLAFGFLQALERAALPQRPTPEDMIRILPRIEDIEILMISAPAIAEIRDISPLHGKDEDGCIIVFQDLSVLWFGRDDALGPYEAFCEPQEVVWPMIVGRDCGAQVMAASPAFTARYGDQESWYEMLAPETDTSSSASASIWWYDIQLELEDCWDPPVGSADDLDPEITYDDEDVAALQKVVDLLFYAAGADDWHDVILSTACKGRPAAFSSDEGPQDLVALLPYLADLSAFHGIDWEPNGGPTDRLSGYEPTPSMVVLAFDPDNIALSNHERLTARSTLHAQLIQRGAPQAIRETFERRVLPPLNTQQPETCTE